MCIALVIDPDSAGAKLARVVLEAEGCVVTVAGSVAAARELLARQSPDRIIMELHFPDADGFAFANELALRFPGMPIIAMTAANGRDLELRASAVGCALYVRKPIDVGVFAAQVHATPLPLPEPLED